MSVGGKEKKINKQKKQFLPVSPPWWEDISWKITYDEISKTLVADQEKIVSSAMCSVPVLNLVTSHIIFSQVSHFQLQKVLFKADKLKWSGLVCLIFSLCFGGFIVSLIWECGSHWHWRKCVEVLQTGQEALFVQQSLFSKQVGIRSFCSCQLTHMLLCNSMIMNVT